VIVSARVTAGRVLSQDSPITRRYYLGGADSHRGFGYNRLSPQVPCVQPTTVMTSVNCANVPPVPVGGNTMLLASFEVRADVYKLKGNWLGVAAFVDAGDVPDAEHGLDLTQLHIAVGPGLRYRTVIGVLRADLGIRLNRLAAQQADGRPNPDPGDRFAFHISIGEAF
jgi:translocation and assembly module TamA